MTDEDRWWAELDRRERRFDWIAITIMIIVLGYLIYETFLAIDPFLKL